MLKHFGVFLIFCLSTFYITFPLLSDIGKYTTGIGDELVIAWIQNWVIHSLLSGNISSIFNANLYYPYQNSLAFSDTFFTSSVVSIIPRILIGEPIVVNNFTLVLSLIFLGFSIYLLSHYLTRSFLPSLLAGILFIFSPAVLSNITHLQMIAICGVPLAILFFLLFLDKQKLFYFQISLLFLLLQTYNSFLPGYFIVISYSVIFLIYWIRNKKKMRKIFTKQTIFSLLITFVLLIPIIIPYYQVSREFNYVRDIRDTIHFAVQPEDFLFPGSTSRLEHFLLDVIPTNKYSQNNEFKPAYLGSVLSLLCIFVIVYISRNRRKLTKEIVIFSLISLTGFALCLGPFLHLFRQTVHHPFPIPLPYLLFYYLVPGFQGFRNSARWEVLFIFAAVIAIALVLKTILSKQPQTKRTFIYIVLIIITIAEFNFPLHTVSVPQVRDFPPVYYWLQSTPKGSIIVEMPIYNWGQWPFTQNELWREYYGTIHFRKTLNGYTGFSPPPWQVTVSQLYNEFPNTETVKLLKKLNVDYIIVDKAQYDSLYKAKQKKIDGNAYIKELKQLKTLKLIQQFDNHYVFEVLR